MTQFPESYSFRISISLRHITDRASISSLNYPVLMFSVPSNSLRTFQLSRRINVMLALFCKRIVMLLDFPSRLSSRNRNFINFKNCAKTKNRTSHNQISSKFPRIDSQRTDLWQADHASANSSSLWPYSTWHQASFFVVRGRKINPILPRCKKLLCSVLTNWRKDFQLVARTVSSSMSPAENSRLAKNKKSQWRHSSLLIHIYLSNYIIQFYR